MCEKCDKLKAKTVTTAAWKAEHRPHLAENSDFLRKPSPHPGEPSWGILVCACGARHITSEA